MLFVTVAALFLSFTDVVRGGTELPEVPDDITIYKVISDRDAAYPEYDNDDIVRGSAELPKPPKVREDITIHKVISDSGVAYLDSEDVVRGGTELPEIPDDITIHKVNSDSDEAYLEYGSEDVVRGGTELPEVPDDITIHKVIGDWDEAYLECDSEGAVLASPINTELLNIMKTLIGVNNTPYFIGTRSRGNSRSFTSVEGVPLRNMTVAVLQMVQHLDPHEGNCLSMDAHSIRVVPCWERLPFLCYRSQIEHTHASIEGTDLMTSITEHEVHTHVCGAEGYKYNVWTVSCYKLHKDFQTWEGAQLNCASEGGHLVVINDHVEAMAIQNLGLKREEPYTFIGLRDYAGDNYWTTVEGKSFEDGYHEWDSPVRYVGQDCGVILPSGKLESSNCSYSTEYVCEIRPSQRTQ